MPGDKKKKPHHNDRKDKNFPYSSADTNQGLHQPYQGYDEEKTNTDRGDYDVDENAMDQRSDEYEDWNRDDKQK